MIRIILYIVLFSGFVFSNISAKLYKFEYQKDIAVGFSAELELTNRIGKIVITGGETGQVTIRAEKYISAESQADAERLSEYIKIDSHRNGNLISITTEHIIPPDKTKSFWEKLFGSKDEQFGSVDFSIEVPSDCKIILDSQKGDISITGISERIRLNSKMGIIELGNIVGNCDIKANGNVTISRLIGDLFLLAPMADISLKEVTGVINIESTTGNKKLEDIKGNTSIEQSSGNVEISKLGGNLRIKSSSGKIDVEQISGGLNILGNRSNVAVKSRLDRPDDYFIETSSGNIRFSIPEGLSGSALMKTQNGEIKADLKLLVETLTKTKVEGRFGNGRGPRIVLTSGSGDIILNSF
ncbi:MAG: DUF4097 family beta strand repeat-containing protein [Candidatus Zixiibacteriota bacterium]